MRPAALWQVTYERQESWRNIAELYVKIETPMLNIIMISYDLLLIISNFIKCKLVLLHGLYNPGENINIETESHNRLYYMLTLKQRATISLIIAITINSY